MEQHFIIRPELLTFLHPLHDDFISFMKIDKNKSLLGWLLGLNAEEYAFVSQKTEEQFIKDTNDTFFSILSILFHYRNIDMKELPGKTIAIKSLSRANSSVRTFVKLIGLYKIGLIDFEMDKQGNKNYNKPYSTIIK